MRYLIVLLVFLIFSGCGKKEEKKEENLTKEPKRDALVDTLLTNSINNLHQLESELDKAINVVNELNPHNSMENRVYETKSLEYEKKIGALLDTIYKLHNKNIELSNKDQNSTNEEVKSNIKNKFDDLLKKYDSLLKNSQRYRVDIKNYKARLDTLLTKIEKEKIEENIAKDMFEEIEIKGE